MTEALVGITEHTTESVAFRAVTKQRYSDFIVHEMRMDGQKLVLTSLVEPMAAPNAADADSAPSAEAVVALTEVLGEETARQAIALHARLQKEAQADGADGADGAKDDGEAAPSEVQCPPDDDKDRRRAQHQIVKVHLPGLTSDTLDLPDGGKCVRLQLKTDVRAAERREWQESGGGKGGKGGKGKGGKGGKGGKDGGAKRRKLDNRDDWPVEAGGNKYLAFTLYKENRDTIDAIGQIARALRMNSNIFTVAGTKDRRAVTTQRVTAFRLPAVRLCNLMCKAPFQDSILVGDVSYVAEPLRLGQHGGNRFTIVLRDIDCAEAAVEEAVRAIDAHGFINYFGLQRFGNNADAPTHHVGAKLLQSDFKGAVQMILSPRAGEHDDERAARELWEKTQDPSAVLQAVMPRKMNVERVLIEGLKQHGINNHLAAYQRIPRGLKSMYLHAFQSYLWNCAASERVRVYGFARAVEGDLVLPECPEATEALEGCDGAEESGGGSAEGGATEAAGWSGAAVHVVTAEEAAAGTYSIDDVVLPMAGSRVALPSNSIAEKYHALLSDHGLSMESFVTKRGISLPGGYRKLIERPRDLVHRVFRYSDPTLPLAPTDLTKLRGDPEPVGDAEGKWVALRLEFTLPPSAYATMCLRELTKQPTDFAHQTMLNANSIGGAARKTDADAQASIGADAAASSGAATAESDGPNVPAV